MPRMTKKRPLTLEAMKAFFHFTLFLCLAATVQAQTSSVPPQPAASATPAPTDLTLKSGAVYRQAVITSTDPAYATIRYRGGIARVDLTDLPDDTRKKVAPSYDPQKAAVFRAADDQASAETSQSLQAQRDRLQAETARAEQLKTAIANADTIYGKVLSIIPKEGVLVTGQMVNHYEENWVCLLRGYDKDVVDGDAIPAVKVIADGTFQYDTAGGSSATVRAFRFVGVAPPKHKSK